MLLLLNCHRTPVSSCVHASGECHQCFPQTGCVKLYSSSIFVEMHKFGPFEFPLKPAREDEAAMACWWDASACLAAPTPRSCEEGRAASLGILCQVREETCAS